MLYCTLSVCSLTVVVTQVNTVNCVVLTGILIVVAFGVLIGVIVGVLMLLAVLAYMRQ